MHWYYRVAKTNISYIRQTPIYGKWDGIEGKINITKTQDITTDIVFQMRFCT